MEITDIQLQRFIELYEKELGISLSPTEAQEKALSLLRFLAISVIPFDRQAINDKMKLPDLS